MMVKCDNCPLIGGLYQVRKCRDAERGDGLFVREDVEEGAVLAFYNGVRLDKGEAEEPSENWEDDAYKILDQTEEENVLDIPEKFRSIDTYCASLAHKTNHSFSPNARFCLFLHPRLQSTNIISPVLSQIRLTN